MLKRNERANTDKVEDSAVTSCVCAWKETAGSKGKDLTVGANQISGVCVVASLFDLLALGMFLWVDCSGSTTYDHTSGSNAKSSKNSGGFAVWL